jgi:diguanylate cyclase (GGDEF)-like protein
MFSFAKMSIQRNIGVLVAVLGILVVGTLATVKFTTDSLLHQDGTSSARKWAQYLAINVADLEQIAAGEQPSSASMAFFRAVQKSGEVFRYEIFNREGFSQLVSDYQNIALVNLSEYSAEAARSVSTRRPVVDAMMGKSADWPQFFARAYFPVIADQRVIAIVGAYVDQTEQREQFHRTFLMAATALCLLTALSFLIPAIAWYRRTKEKQQADRRIRYLAHHDALTGLTNRPRLVEKLENALGVLTAGGRHLAVHFIDVDHFKDINDTLGHDGGDFLLKTIADRLRAVTRRDDVAARLGGDEFVVVQVDVKDKIDAREFAQRLVASLRAPLQFGESAIVPTFSVGVALAPADGSKPERLLKSADLALYKSKSDAATAFGFSCPRWTPSCRPASSWRGPSAVRSATTGSSCIISPCSK